MTTYFSKQEGEICKSRQAGALQSSSTTFTSETQTPTYVEVSLSFTHCRWMNTSTVRQECTILSFAYDVQTTADTGAASMLLWFVGCHNSTALNSLHCSIRSKVVTIFVCVWFRFSSDSPEMQQVRRLVRFSLRHLRFSLRSHTSVLLYSDTVFALAMILSDSGERMHGDKIPPQRMHAAYRIVTRGSCCTKRFAEFNGNCESYCSLEQLVASLCAADERNLLPVRIIRRQKATPEDTQSEYG